MVKLYHVDYDIFERTDGVTSVKAQLICDTAAELPAPDGIEGYKLTMGSVAYVIESGELYMMSSDGQWHKC